MNNHMRELGTGNWITADMFRRRFETAMYERIMRTEPLSAEEVKAIRSDFECYQDHLLQAVEQFTTAENIRHQ